ncbi:WG repeat-containing protein [Chryseobacterium sp. JUb7]|uniref:WG repeat-containing protein n=1 Tax=Chryseobacterium sp. JUb7 TaxID=2940599 RepID=UPI0021686FF1|nr:WG repeat-containing protein [Chryseobacterium sp. JUb7]MCS3530698.1 hypothetical protein [Chryseobacterium sp. JUb7]
MKKIYLLFLFIFSILTYSQFKKITRIHNDTIFNTNSNKKEYPFEGRFLLTGEFMPVKKDSTIKLAKVLTANGWGLINEKGEIVLAPQYFNISEFRNGLINATLLVPNQSDKNQLDQCHALFNVQGKMVTPKCYYRNDMENDGFGELRIKNTSELAEGLIKVRTNKFMSIYNDKGEQIIPAEYSDITFSGKYFLAQKETPKRHFDIYDNTGKKIKTIESADVYITGHLALIRNNWKTYIENLVTGKKYFEDQINSLSPVSYEQDRDDEKIILFATNYADGKYGDVKSTSYINKDYEIIHHNIFTKTLQKIGKENILAENPENKDIALLDYKGKIVQQYSYEEFNNYSSLSSNGYQNEKNLQENLYKHFPLWSKYSMSSPATELKDFYVILIRNKNNPNNNENIFIQKESGKILHRIKRNAWYYDTFSKSKYLIAQIENSYAITDIKGNILKTSKSGQAFHIFMDQLFIEENEYKYPTDQNFNPIYTKKYSNIEQIKYSTNYIATRSQKTEIYNGKGEVIQTIDGSMPNYSDYYFNRDYLIIHTDKSKGIFNKKTMKPLLQFNFKSTYDGQIDAGLFVHEEYNDTSVIKTYIDPYMNVVKITY